MEKDARFEIRIPESLKADFLGICGELDLPAAQVVRELLTTYVRNQRQPELFDTDSKPSRKRGRK